MPAIQRLLAATAFSLVVASCASPSAPTPPDVFVPRPPSSALPPPPAPAPVNNSVLVDATLSGRVYEVANDSSGRHVGVEGVSVYCEQCGESTHNYSYTDSNGEYVFPRGVWTEGRPSFPIRIWVVKGGYQDPAGLPKPTPPNPSGPGWREVVIHGDTRFGIELVRR